MPSELSDILPELLSGLQGKPESLLILGADGPAPTMDNVVGVFSFAEADQLPAERQADLGVFWRPTRNEMTLIAKARDVLCDRLLLLDPVEWTSNELLALGFHKASAEPAAFVCSAETTTAVRDWNSPKHWANPENFDKYRW